MQRTASPIIAQMFTAALIFGITGFVRFIICTFTKAAPIILAMLIIFRPPFRVELTTRAILLLVVGTEVFPSQAVLTGVVVPLVIHIISVSGHCFPPYQESRCFGGFGGRMFHAKA